MSNFEIAEPSGQETKVSHLNLVDLESDNSSSSTLADSWKVKSVKLASTDLDIKQNGDYTVQFGDSLSAIAKRSLRMQGEANPSGKVVQSEQDRIVQLNSEQYPHLQRHPEHIWDKMDLQIIPNELLQARNEVQQPIQGEVVSNQEIAESDFQGLDLGIIKLGIKPGDHALAFGLDIGILDFDAQVGRETRGDIEVGLGELVGVKGGAGLGIDKGGLHGDANGRGHFLADNVMAGGEVAANIGPKSGAGVNADANVGPIGAAVGGDAILDKNGLNAGYDASGGIKNVVDGHTDGGISLSDNSNIGAGAGIGLFDLGVDGRAGLVSRENTVLRPTVSLTGKAAEDSLRGELGAQIGPALDAEIGTGYSHLDARSKQESGRDLIFGFGANGVGFRASRHENGKRFNSRYGVGRFKGS